MLTYLYPVLGKGVGNCIRLATQHRGDTVDESISYFNPTVPDRLLQLVKEDQLKLIDYVRVNELHDLIEAVEGLRKSEAAMEKRTIVVESLDLIVNNTKVEYNELNYLVMRLLRFLKQYQGDSYIIDVVKNDFVSLNCHQSKPLESYAT